MTVEVVIFPPAQVGMVATPIDPVEINVAPQGVPGPPGASGGTYSQQFTSAATWTVQHNLGSKPEIVLVIDDERVYAGVTYPDNNTAVVEWPSAQSGWAYAR